MAEKIQPNQSGTGKATQKRSNIGDSKDSMSNQRKAMEIPPKTVSGGKTKK
jgi:hypothetical protein